MNYKDTQQFSTLKKINQFKINQFQNKVKSKFTAQNTQQLYQFLKLHIYNTTLQGISRIEQVQIVLKISKQNITLYQQFFSSINLICQLISQARQLYDLAWIVKQYTTTNLKQVNDRIVQKYQKRFQLLFQQTFQFQSLLYVQSFNLFLTVSQSSTKIPNPTFFNQIFIKQRQQCSQVYQYVIKPLFQKKNLKNYYKKLINLVNWLIFIQNKIQLIVDLAKKIDVFILYHKNENSIQMIMVFNKIFDLLSVKLPKQTNLFHHNLTILIIKFIKTKNIKISNFFITWLSQRSKLINTIDFQHLFITLGSLGFGGLVIELIIALFQQLKTRKLYNNLLRIFSNYIRKQYLSLQMTAKQDITGYVKIAKLFMCSFCNRQRFEGQQIDLLTINLCKQIADKNLSLNSSYKQIIQFYSLYQNRFSYLSETSKRFFNQIKLLYRISIQTSQLHAIFQQYIILQINNQENQWNMKTSYRYRGLQNMGNTCYINSFMQALFMTKKFRNYIHNLTKEGDLASDKFKIYALSNLFEELSHKELDIQNPFQPQIFRSQLSQPYRSTKQQQDAAQFARVYLQQLSKQLQFSDRQKIQKILGQKLIRVIRCENCKNKKIKRQQVFDIILNVQQSNNDILVSKAIANYFSTQTFNNDNKVYCQKCVKNTDSLSQLIPQKLSDILVFTLSIFQYVGQGRKILTPLNFQFSLDLQGILSGDWGQYQLYAFVVHLGKLMGAGHYITYARNLQQNPMLWYCFDDGHVRQLEIVRPQQFRFSQSQTPYMLFYSKKGSNLNSSTKIRPQKKQSF